MSDCSCSVRIGILSRQVDSLCKRVSELEKKYKKGVVE